MASTSTTGKHAVSKQYQCEQCGKVFNKKYNLKQHELTHSEQRLYRCTICNKEFKQERGLGSHKRIHTRENAYWCDNCSKKFFSSQNHRRHTLKCCASDALTSTSSAGEKAAVKQYPCDECGKVFKKKSLLNRHMVVHTGERPYKCNMCDNDFQRRSQLKEHIQFHTYIKPYTCDNCGNKFFFSKTYSVHKKLCMNNEMVEDPLKENKAPMSNIELENYLRLEARYTQNELSSKTRYSTSLPLELENIPDNSVLRSQQIILETTAESCAYGAETIQPIPNIMELYYYGSSEPLNSTTNSTFYEEQKDSDDLDKAKTYTYL